MKILLLGHDGAGKTTTAGLLKAAFGISYADSSMFACEVAVYPHLKEKYGYTSAEECHADRGSHREEWKTLIRKFNGEDPSRLSKAILEVCDMYVGMRHHEEYEPSKGLFDIILWLDASGRVDPKGSGLTIKQSPEMVVIPANVSKKHTKQFIQSKDFALKVISLMKKT